MKIREINITAFGKHKNLHLEFPDGFTVFYAPNEWGKTTLMAFIRMMFYGNAGKSSDIGKNPRKKYRPWNSDIMAGSVVFNHEGRNYRLEREFKGSNSADKIDLIDLDTNEIYSLSGKGDIGEKFFSMTDGAFERSVFIGNLKDISKNEAADGEINSKLSVLSSEDDASFDEVFGRLKTANEELFSKSGKVGKCDKAKFSLLELERQLAEASEKEKIILDLQKSIAEKEEEAYRASILSAEKFNLLKSADKIKKRFFIERYIETMKTKAALEEKLSLKNGKVINEDFFLQCKERLDQLDQLEKRNAELKDEVEKLQIRAEVLCNSKQAAEECLNGFNLEKLNTQSEEIDRKAEEQSIIIKKLKAELELPIFKKKIRPVLSIIGLVFLVVGFCGAVYTTLQIPCLCIGLLGAFLALCGLIFRKKVAFENPDLRRQLIEASTVLNGILDKKQQILKNIEKRELEFSDTKDSLSSARALHRNALADLSRSQEAIVELEAKYDALLSEFLHFVSSLCKCSYKEMAVAVIDEAENYYKQLEQLTQTLPIISANANCNSVEDAEKKLSAYDSLQLPDGYSENDLENIKEDFKSASDNSSKLRSELSAMKAQLKAAEEQLVSTEVLKRKKKELQEKIDAYILYGKTANIAADTLEEAFREMRKSFSGTLDSRTAEIFRTLTNQHYENISVSKNFDLSFNDKYSFGTKKSVYLSTGAEDQLYLSLRLALSEMICENGESLPILMDDPLYSFDDSRAFLTLDFLKKYSADKQIIMLTCHSALADMARELKINIKEL